MLDGREEKRVRMAGIDAEAPRASRLAGARGSLMGAPIGGRLEIWRAGHGPIRMLAAIRPSLPAFSSVAGWAILLVDCLASGLRIVP